MVTSSDARVALLAGLVDHAPLFPPASLPLDEAVEEDRRARASTSSFALGRFVCPASLLERLPDVERRVSVVLDAAMEPSSRVVAVEVPPLWSLDDLPAAEDVYVEVPVDDALEERLDEVAARGLAAKVRCGGASVPEAAGLARFIRGCGERGLAFKATAGLHHAVASAGEHGFLNLLAAVVFGDEEAALEERDAGTFGLDAHGFRWRDRSASADELAGARRRLHAIGSCSFFEPVEELEALGALPL